MIRFRTTRPVLKLLHDLDDLLRCERVSVIHLRPREFDLLRAALVYASDRERYQDTLPFRDAVIKRLPSDAQACQ